MRALLLTVLAASPLGGAGCLAEAPDDTGAPLRSLVQSTRHPDLNWPAFPEFRSELERLYERAAWQPLWLRGTRCADALPKLVAYRLIEPSGAPSRQRVMIVGTDSPAARVRSPSVNPGPIQDNPSLAATYACLAAGMGGA